jgi:hypothetical protein
VDSGKILRPIARDQDGDRPGLAAGDPPRSLETAYARHVDVDEDEIGLKRCGELDRRLARRGVADKLEAGVALTTARAARRNGARSSAISTRTTEVAAVTLRAGPLP